MLMLQEPLAIAPSYRAHPSPIAHVRVDSQERLIDSLEGNLEVLDRTRLVLEDSRL